MKAYASENKATRRTDPAVQRSASTGDNAVTLAPPPYGIGFADQGASVPAPVRLPVQLAAAPRQRAAEQGEPGAAHAPRGAAARANDTGLPDDLKTGVESLSGMSMDHVKVHFNSSRPAQLNALAYAQGTDIHVASGQERYLPHEAWHVVQQAQGRVTPTMQMKDGVQINDDRSLEHEADVMGARALESKSSPHRVLQPIATSSPVKQLRLVDREVFGITHLVKFTGEHLYNEQYRENEGLTLQEGDIVRIETDSRLYSRRGPNQEVKKNREADGQTGREGPHYPWFEVKSLNGRKVGEDFYVREDTIRPKKWGSEEKKHVGKHAAALGLTAGGGMIAHMATDPASGIKASGLGELGELGTSAAMSGAILGSLSLVDNLTGVYSGHKMSKSEDAAERAFGADKMREEGASAVSAVINVARGTFGYANYAQNGMEAVMSMGKLTDSAKFTLTGLGKASAGLGIASSAIDTASGLYRGGQAASRAYKSHKRREKAKSDNGRKWFEHIYERMKKKGMLQTLKVIGGALGIASGALILASNPVGWAIGIASAVIGGGLAAHKFFQKRKKAKKADLDKAARVAAEARATANLPRGAAEEARAAAGDMIEHHAKSEQYGKEIHDHVSGAGDLAGQILLWRPWDSDAFKSPAVEDVKVDAVSASDVLGVTPKQAAAAKGADLLAKRMSSITGL